MTGRPVPPISTWTVWPGATSTSTEFDSVWPPPVHVTDLATDGEHTRSDIIDLEAAVLVGPGRVLDDAVEPAAVEPGRYSLTRGTLGADLDDTLDPAPGYEGDFGRGGQLFGRAEREPSLVDDNDPGFLIT